MNKSEITEEFVEDAKKIPKEDRSFLVGFLNGVTTRMNMEQEDERSRNLQKAN